MNADPRPPTFRDVTFIRDFEWRPRSGVTLVHKAGFTIFVTRRCAEAALACGAAKPARERAPRKGKGDGQTK